MSKKTEYIVDISTGEVIWITKGVKGVLLAYYMLGYDTARGFYFFTSYRKREILEIINYESTMVT